MAPHLVMHVSYSVRSQKVQHRCSQGLHLCRATAMLSFRMQRLLQVRCRLRRLLCAPGLDSLPVPHQQRARRQEAQQYARCNNRTSASHAVQTVWPPLLYSDASITIAVFKP